MSKSKIKVLKAVEARGTFVDFQTPGLDLKDGTVIKTIDYKATGKNRKGEDSDWQGFLIRYTGEIDGHKRSLLVTVGAGDLLAIQIDTGYEYFKIDNDKYTLINTTIKTDSEGQFVSPE